MRALLVLMMSALAGCATAAPPPEAGSAASEPGVSEPAASDSTPADAMDLTRGKRVETLGLQLMLRGTRTEHQSVSAKVIRAELEVRKGGEESIISLQRAQPGDVEFVPVFDTEIALESVDTSQRPSTARILLRP